MSGLTRRGKAFTGPPFKLKGRGSRAIESDVSHRSIWSFSECGRLPSWLPPWMLLVYLERLRGLVAQVSVQGKSRIGSQRFSLNDFVPLNNLGEGSECLSPTH